MKDEIRLHAAKQGIGSIFIPDRCRVCNYLAITWAEKMALIQTASECPNCKTTGKKALITLSNYIDVANWVGEYTISSNRRDYASAVIMFCALFESCLEEIKQDYMDAHPDVKLEFESNERATLTDVLGSNLSQLLEQAPSDIKMFPIEWKEMRDKRNSFLHGKSSSYHINQADANKAMDLVANAVATFAWLNNKYCLRKI